MKVFCSWSGQVSRELACTFRDWLPMVLQHVEAYVSSEDIDKGARWLTDIVGELDSTYYGILFITNENFAAPWLNFEAGALTKAVKKARVSPFVFDMAVTDFSGPLTQFQAATFDKDDIYKLVLSINNAEIDGRILAEDRLRLGYEKWWPELEGRLKSIQNTHSGKKKPHKPTNQERLMSEILELTRSHQNLLRTPEVLFPPDYFHNLFREARGTPLRGVDEINKTLEIIDRTMYSLTNLYDAVQPKIRGVKKRDLDDFVKLMESLRSAVRRLEGQLRA